MLVVVRMSNGTTRTIMSSMDVLLNCHVGSRIRLTRQGALESVSPLGCAPGN
jgi:hypothetical protein